MLSGFAIVLACLAQTGSGRRVPAPRADAPEILVTFFAEPSTSLPGESPNRPQFYTSIARAVAERLNCSYPFLRWSSSGTSAAYHMDVRLRLTSRSRAAVAVETFTIQVTPQRPSADGCARYAFGQPQADSFPYEPPVGVRDRVAALADLIVAHISADSPQKRVLGPIRVPYGYRPVQGRPNGVVETTLDALNTDAAHLAFRVDYWGGDGRESCVDTRIQLSPHGRTENSYIYAVFDSLYYGNRGLPAEPAYLSRLQQYRGLSVVKYVRIDLPSRVTSNGTVQSTRFP